MLFAETERLYLRALEKSELPRMVELLDVWDIARWLTVVPYPYTMRDAEEFYNDMSPYYATGAPQLHALALKTDNQLIGAVGLHPPRTPDAQEGEVEIGYWLGRDYWGRGLMGEAACAAVKLAFARPTTRLLGASTAPNNIASQKILSKAGLRNMGIEPRRFHALRGSDEVVKWLLTREEYEQGGKTE